MSDSTGTGLGLSSTGLLPLWLSNFVETVGLYLVVFFVGYHVLKHFQRRGPPDPSDPAFKSRMIRFFFFGPPEELPQDEIVREKDKVTSTKPKESVGVRALKLLFCTCGLLISFLSWGVVQERVMTTEYQTGRFTSSNFMVFCSRIVGLAFAISVTQLTEQPRLKAPFYKYSFTSLSNVLSSFCQLEALKYLSFPTQVLGKSSKLIPVMVMGKIIQKKTYPLYEYVVAVIILIGVAIFVISEKGEKANKEQETTFAGLVLLVGYLTFDSFTSQWQGHLFSQYNMSSYQMMLGVNTFSASFTFVSLLTSRELFTAIDFVLKNPDCFYHIALFSICGATGSMFIFYTIKTFGPLVFTMIMVTRQLVAIVLSCFFYGHHIDSNGISGAVIVFAAIGYRIYAKEQENKTKKQNAAS
uniref:Adenosine 3'-phospho 5'-phosphosulfate transporter 1 n=1 Tax=Aplanochytrium stocchinoi TaxID=215587 RepID=A0A7S3PP77_9STRA|mmetsp:Transcript_12442/g.15432  ORF Transcript_12442/g.15432 Transcript_12442/m.15432 type:complete len:412 (+) Transcript_12442:93-1328(+)